MSKPIDIYHGVVAYRDLTETIFRHPDGTRIKIMTPIKPSKLDKLVQSLKLSDYDASWRNEGGHIVFEFKPVTI